jgi:hypothetical protein
MHHKLRERDEAVSEMPTYEASTGLPTALPRAFLLESGILALAVLVFVIIEPFGIFRAAGWPVRLLYWLRTMMVGYALYRTVLSALTSGTRRYGLPPLSRELAAIIVSSAPTAMWLWYFGPVIQLHRPLPSAGDFADTYFQVFALAVLVVGTFQLARGRGHQPRSNTAPDSQPERVGENLRSRLPKNFGQDILALQMEDHYVRVHGAASDTLILMRMGDAVQALAAINGAQVHRSWWVARKAVASAIRNGRAAELVLTNGLRVPVARNRIPGLRHAGWLT